MGKTMKQRGVARKVYACAFGALAAVLLAPSTVARADQTDEDFTTYLQAHGVNLGSPAMDVKAAQVMCKDLDVGYTEKDEVDQLTGAKRMSQGQAQLFVGAATADYCPQHHPASKPSSK
jgi:Protein of unknown function (DUF732)